MVVGTNRSAVRRRAGRAPLPPAPDTISATAERGGLEPGGRAVGAPVEDEMRRRAARPPRALAPTRACDPRQQPRRRPSRADPDASRARTECAPRSRSPRRRSGARARGTLASAASAREVPARSVRPSFSSSGLREVAESVEQTFDHVDLCLRERGIEPDAARGDAVAGTRLDDVAARGARQVRVVEDDFAVLGFSTPRPTRRQAPGASRRARRG